ncbi:hypothetical protein M427DRAFT_43567 [Gonapodya prolifera JEL478]|uniref:Uncharacterized protein n=1 Tax=Gonapodya prolifera (strain JEL478) TaxID=1344416 RepID=A0A139AIU5_GONPJ|nr:hypothetical protein M427DRAFT_43567 [Gonapodya prolifera JEL478]|eukprot:KXS16484.1 hypothetical protein M427DRAFT_43567 [Gonapodya prolifera JEL478]
MYGHVLLSLNRPTKSGSILPRIFCRPGVLFQMLSLDSPHAPSSSSTRSHADARLDSPILAAPSPAMEPREDAEPESPPPDSPPSFAYQPLLSEVETEPPLPTALRSTAETETTLGEDVSGSDTAGSSPVEVGNEEESEADTFGEFEAAPAVESRVDGGLTGSPSEGTADWKADWSKLPLVQPVSSTAKEPTSSRDTKMSDALTDVIANSHISRPFPHFTTCSTPPPPVAPSEDAQRIMEIMAAMPRLTTPDWAKKVPEGAWLKKFTPKVKGTGR